MIRGTNRSALATSISRGWMQRRRFLPGTTSARTVSAMTPAIGAAPSTTLHPSSFSSRCDLILLRSHSTAAATAKEAAKATNAKKDDDKSNVFLDNLGTIFLAGIGLIVVSLVRSYRGSTNRNQARERLEQQASLDPLEIDDLRVANSELTLPVYREILRTLKQSFPDPDAAITYAEFVRSVRITMKDLKGGAFTVELGHLLDRVVMNALHRRGSTTETAQPLSFWMTVLSLALAAPVPDRIRALFEVLQGACGDSAPEAPVTLADTRAMVGYLQDTCQLTPDSQVVETNQKYPVQQYDKGNVGQLFEWEGSEEEALDIDAFASVLRSRAVCVWGECYHRRKVV